MAFATDPPLACNLHAIPSANRPRYHDLVGRLRGAMGQPSELDDGFVYCVDTAHIALTEITEWIAMERLCCPFLRFQLDIVAGETRLALRGPEGIKAILRAEFPSA